MGVDHRLDTQPATAEMAGRQAAMGCLAEDQLSEATSVATNTPRATPLQTVPCSQHLLQLHLRISPKMRALEIPP